ncbi:RNA polymerase sigma factor [Candidatus Peregrinibacteria bacterium]|nr:RNA polymerase sigma factor [Candidatus Peregrinibacteria bacterium]
MRITHQMRNSEHTLLSDEALVLASHQDMNAFGYLVERYETLLLRYIMRISSFSREEAEEILQEIFVKAWRHLNDFDSSLKFKSWIYRIAHNETISEFRKAESRGKGNEISWDEEILADFPSKIDIVHEVHQKLQSEHIRKVLSLLNEKYRTVLILFFLEEKSYEEISDILQIPTGTVATYIKRGKESLKDLLKKYSDISQ